jgi:hypothetical protein
MVNVIETEAEYKARFDKAMSDIIPMVGFSSPVGNCLSCAFANHSSCHLLPETCFEKIQEFCMDFGGGDE